MALFGIHAPAHVCEALRSPGCEPCQARAAHAVYRDAPALGDVATDGLARYGMAATSKHHQYLAGHARQHHCRRTRLAVARCTHGTGHWSPGLSQFSLQGAGDLCRRDVARAQRREEVVQRLEGEMLEQPVMAEVSDGEPLQLPLQVVAAVADILLAVLLAEEGAQLIPGPRCVEEASLGVQPVAARLAVALGLDLHLVAVGEHMADGD